MLAGLSVTLYGCARPAASPDATEEERAPSAGAEIVPLSSVRRGGADSPKMPTEEDYRKGRPGALMDYLFEYRQPEIPPPGAPIIELNLTELMLDQEVLGAIGTLPDLEILLLGTTNVDDSGISLLTNLPRLQLLGLRQTLITDEALPHLAQIPSLRKIYLSDTPLTDSGIAHLAAIEGLQQLALKNTEITAQGLAKLQELTTLERLWLDSTPIGDEAVALIARSFPRLEVLFIGDTGVTDAGVSELAALSSLAVLNLEATEVSDASIPTLAGMKNLVRIQLKDTAVTSAGIEALAAQNPDLKVFTAGTSPSLISPPANPQENLSDH